MSFASVINKYRTQSLNKADQGTHFEQLCKSFLKTASIFAGQGIKDVWLWNEFPARKDFGSGHDVGIDIVVMTENQDYWAVQCKCYGANTQIDKSDIDTFISSSGRSFHDVYNYEKKVNFSRRLFLDTSEKGLSKNAEDSLENQNPPVNRLSYRQLERLDVDWDKLDQGVFGEGAKKQKYDPKDYQNYAIEKTHTYFQAHDRGKLIMACGTGKTYTSLKIAEKETEGKDGTILFLAPSIALVGQTLKEWCEQAINPIHGVCVCSDPDVVKKKNKNLDSDDIQESVVSLALPASTSIDEIIKNYNQAKLLQKQDQGLVVIFSTYQSISVVSGAQKQLSDKMVFDLCICDEAHRTTGVSLKETDSSEFVKVHDPLVINASKRLYMTATPRLYSDSVKQKAKDADAILCSMDDSSIYGDEIYRIGFGSAVQKGLLTDYKVMILTLNEDDMSAALQDAIRTEDSEIPTDDSLKLIGCINALSKITKEKDLLATVDPGLMHNAIGFCQNIKTSKKLARYFEVCRDAYNNTLTEEERRDVVEIHADHVDGGMSATERDQKLSWLSDVDRKSNKCNVLMNVKCLSEGVDVPSLDAILFLSARNSQVDVVQSVGRVMRRAKGKKYGYIIIPVVIPSNMTPEEALDDNKRFSVVWSVLQALRAHDDRFNANINQIELNKKKPDNILIGGSVGSDISYATSDDLNDKVKDETAKQLELQFEEFQGAIYAKIVKKCGDRRYWEQWASDIAQIAQRHIVQINKLIEDNGSPANIAFEKYLKGLHSNINPSVTKEEAVEMLAQHFITQPVFQALFEDFSFVNSNPISRAMAGMVDVLNRQTSTEDKDKLDKFYASVRERCKGLDNGEAKQKVVVELYNKFFKTAFPKTVEKLGIVYTPIEIVDFIINSCEDIINKEFNCSMTDEGVHILDPFTGTGTFIVRLLQSGIIKPEDIGRKYKNELHACEIVLLAYYIASINIESTYHDMLPACESDKENTAKKNKDYEEFEGIVLTDTFQMTEDKSTLLDDMFPQNSKRAEALKATPLTVIMGNPPYSRQQSSANKNIKKDKYPTLESRIQQTYSKNARGSSTGYLQDSYIRAFRWSSDRLNESNGIIAFISNSGWLDAPATAGMRKCLEEEFNKIYLIDLRGARRGLTPEMVDKSGGSVFNIQTGVSITILVKNNKSRGCKIYYTCTDDYMSAPDKLEYLRLNKSALSKGIRYKQIRPDENFDWITFKTSQFTNFFALAPESKGKAGSHAFFVDYALGVNTNRDYWLYGYSHKDVCHNTKLLADNYNHEVDQAIANSQYQHTWDARKIKWSSRLEDLYESRQKLDWSLGTVKTALYRPFCKQFLFFEQKFIHRPSRWMNFYPDESVENLTICVPGDRNRKDFTCLITDHITDLNIFDGGSQCFSLYWYEKQVNNQYDLFLDNSETYKKHDNISDFILQRAREKYGSTVSKIDLFYYVCGILHDPNYSKQFNVDLHKTLPRIPLISSVKAFWEFCNAGRLLADLQINYDKLDPYSEVSIEGDNGNYEISSMSYEDNKSRIRYNDDIVICNIPEKVYRYEVANKSMIDWIVEQYCVKTDVDSAKRKGSYIVKNPNELGKENGNPRYVLDLLLSAMQASIKIINIIDNLPVVDWDKE